MSYRTLTLFIMSTLLLSACGGSSEHNEPSAVSDDSGENSSGAPSSLAVDAVTDESVTLTWRGVEEASHYRIYYASESIVDADNIHAHEQGNWVTRERSPQTISNLSTNVTFYFVVTAVVDGSESTLSNAVSATPMSEAAGPQPSAQEVRMMELINRARFDPQAEVERDDEINDLNDGLEAGTITATQKPPLAFNEHLMIAARDHSNWMLENDTFEHTGEDGSSPQDRIQASGYGSPSLSAENISVIGGGHLNPTFVIDEHHRSLFRSEGHRENIFREKARELGVAQELGDYVFKNQRGPAAMLTQNYATIGNHHFITGVVYTDHNGNDIYDVGEGMSNVSITFEGETYRAYNAGIYSIPIANNSTYRVTISGGDLPEPVETEVEVIGQNVKLDIVVDNDTVNVVTW